MIRTIAISNYRSLLNVSAPLDRLNVVTGANGSGKSNIYRALRLLSASATGQLIPGLAAEGGLQSALWAGPQSRTELSPEPMPDDSRNVRPVRLQLGFSSDTFSYSIDLGLPVPHHSAFSLDPVIKRECVWLGSSQSPKTLCADRNGPIVKCRNASGEWVQIYDDASPFEGLMTRYADPVNAPELIALRFQLQQWRFYDYLRTDLNAPARQTQIGTRTLCLANDGANLAAAIQTIKESPNSELFEQAIDVQFGIRAPIVLRSKTGTHWFFMLALAGMSHLHGNRRRDDHGKALYEIYYGSGRRRSGVSSSDMAIA